MVMMTTPRTIQEYAASLNITYRGDVDPRCGGLFIAPRGAHDDHINVLRIDEYEDGMILSCLVALIGDGWADAARTAYAVLAGEEPNDDVGDDELAEAVVIYGYPLDPMGPAHYFDDFQYERVIPWDDVPDDDQELMQLLIPYIDRIAP